jgi:hypothetical protein
MPSIYLYFSVQILSTAISTTSAETTTQGKHTIFISNNAMANTIIQE